MFWTESPPTKPAPTPDIPAALEAGTIAGPRRSGKTTLLQEASIQKQPVEKCLVIIPWPTERANWEAFLKQAEAKNVTIHTPDSLARHLLTQWAKTKKKEIRWILDANTESTTEEEFAKKLLDQGELTPGAAHWLLQQEMGSFIKKNLLPGKVRKLLLDEPDEWEPEAASWCRKIPADELVETTRTSPGTIQLSGWINHEKKRNKFRWIETETTQEGAGEWTCRQLRETPEKQPTAVIIQGDKTTWEKYLKTRCKPAFEILHASETEGRRFHKIIIPALTRNWGSPKNARDWLDLVAAKTQNCLARIQQGETPHWIPKPDPSKKYLGWDA